MKQVAVPHQTPNLDCELPNLQTVRNTFMLFIRHQLMVFCYSSHTRQRQSISNLITEGAGINIQSGSQLPVWFLLPGVHTPVHSPLWWVELADLTPRMLWKWRCVASEARSQMTLCFLPCFLGLLPLAEARHHAMKPLKQREAERGKNEGLLPTTTTRWMKHLGSHPRLRLQMTAVHLATDSLLWEEHPARLLLKPWPTDIVWD